MAETKEIKVPDIGDFDEVDVIEVLVKAGDTVEKEDSLITLESDKATMEVPAPFAGTIKDIKVGVGDKVSEGTVIATAEAAGEAPEEQAREDSADETPAPERAAGGRARRKTDTAIRGRGPVGRRLRRGGRRRRPGRLHRRLPRRRPGAEDRAGGAVPGLGRCLPQRRLYTVQGAAPCRRAAQRGRPLRRKRHRIRQAQGPP